MAEDQQENSSSTPQQTPTPKDVADKAGKPAEKTFTQEQVDKIVQERLARQKNREEKTAPTGDKPSNKPTKPADPQPNPLQAQLNESKLEIQKLKSQIAQADREKKISQIKTAVAAKYGISDPTVLTGESEDDIKADAEKLLKVFRPYDRMATARSSQTTPTTRTQAGAQDFARAMRQWEAKH